MKLVHLSDLHLGKRVNEFSMLEDQEYILKQLLVVLDAEQPDGVIIAGDVYDKPIPPAEAVALFDDFLYALAKRKLPVFIISGNHDSAERIAFGGRLLENSQVYVSPVYGGEVKPISVEDEYGTVDVYLLPFIKPVHVRRFFPEEEIGDYTDALRVAVSHMELNSEHRNLLVTHQFVTGAARCESEELSIGGSDNVDGAVFADFDYVALGHLHGPQNIRLKVEDKNENVVEKKETEDQEIHARYCGTLLKYSFSECRQKKSVTVVELKEKGAVDIRTILVKPLRDLVEIKGLFQEVISDEFRKNLNSQDYYHITLTDEEDQPNAIGRLRVCYPNIMRLDYDNQRTRSNQEITVTDHLEEKNPLQLIQEFYELQNNQPLGNEQSEYVKGLLERIQEN